jgi:hypothetical protein
LHAEVEEFELMEHRHGNLLDGIGAAISKIQWSPVGK